MPWEITAVPPTVPKGEPGSKRKGDLRQLNQADCGVNQDTCRMLEDDRAVAGNRLYPKPCGVGLPMTC